MPPNCPWAAPSRATIVSRGGRTPGGAERSASVRAAYEFFADWDLSTNGVRRWIDGRELEQADQCKRIFGKSLGEPRAVSSAVTTVRCASFGFSRDFCRQAVRGWRVKSGPTHDRPESTFCGRWRARRWTPLFGREAGLQYLGRRCLKLSRFRGIERQKSRVSFKRGFCVLAGGLRRPLPLSSSVVSFRRGLGRSRIRLLSVCSCFPSINIRSCSEVEGNHNTDN